MILGEYYKIIIFLLSEERKKNVEINEIHQVSMRIIEHTRQK